MSYHPVIHGTATTRDGQPFVLKDQGLYWVIVSTRKDGAACFAVLATGDARHVRTRWRYLLADGTLRLPQSTAREQAT